jgi:[ribosomal protein S5]-alanine N-acetyltransferase
MRDTIETQRLTLRPFTANDVAPVVALCGDWDVARMLARVPHPYRDADAIEWIETIPGRRDAGTDFVFAITSAREGVMGAIGIDLRDEQDAFTLGYWLGKPFWRQGYATEAGAAVLAHATEDLGVAQFLSEHFVGNEVSGRVLKKLGFDYTGEMREMPCLARGEHVPARLMARPPKLRPERQEGGHDS